MPYENEHACRLRDPDDFQDGSFRREKRKHNGKEYSVIQAKLKGKDTMTDQAFRYDKKKWSAEEAKKHCKEHDGRFEAAKKEDESRELERKSFTGIELKKDKPGAFIARIATLNVIDKDGDVTLPGAFPEGKTILISAYMHGSWMGELPVGKGVIHEAGEDALVEGEFNLNTETGKEHYETIKFAPELQEWSYGFRVIDMEEDAEWEGNHVRRILKKLDVFEASPVLRGAGMNTAVLAIKNDKEKGLTFNDQAEAALAAVNDLVARAKSLADLRRKEGRELSKPSREEILKLQKGLGEVEIEIKVLLDTPKDAESEGIKAELKRSLKTIKKIYGGK